jgi:hypothetical protein
MAEALTFNEYPFLKELGLQEENLGCYNGAWVGNGPIITAVNPSNGKPIARVKGVRGFSPLRFLFFDGCSFPGTFLTHACIILVSTQASTEDYESCIQAMMAARKLWQAVR